MEEGKKHHRTVPYIIVVIRSKTRDVYVILE